MENVKTIFFLGLIGLGIWTGWSAFVPYWDGYVLRKVVHDVAQYGTVNSQEMTMKKLLRSVEEEGWNFSASDFSIQKDKSDSVTISLRYVDVVKVFGFVLWEIDFKISETAQKVRL